MKRLKSMCLLTATLLAGSIGPRTGPATAGAGGQRKLPPGWTVVESIVVPEQQLAAFSKKLGGQITGVANTSLAVDGRQIKINTIACATDADATKVHEQLLKVHKNFHVLCPKDGKRVFELVAKDLRLVERVYLELGIKKPQVVYDVSFQAAPLVNCVPMAWNKLYNAFLPPEPNETLVRNLAKNFVFGDQIRVRNSGLGSEDSSFAFTPKPLKIDREASAADADITTYFFGEVPDKFGIPQVGVKAVITSEAYAFTPSKRKAGKELLGPTEFWPSKDPNIVALAQQITGDKTAPADKVAALLAWCATPSNLRPDNQIVGSRYGVHAVLKQRYGMCWDFSDVFVTLCRASGVPCRQVLGWLHGYDGHVWAEVLLDSQGWRQVDPTTGMGCDCRYVPIFATESGVTPAVYTSAVRITPR